MQFKACQYVRLLISAVGFVTGVAFIIYGGTVDSQSTFSYATIAVGSLLSVQSVCICATGTCSDRLVKKIMDELHELNEELTSQTHHLQILTTSYQVENSKLKKSIEDIALNNEQLKERTDELNKSAQHLRVTNEQYNVTLKHSRDVVQEMAARIQELQDAKQLAEHELAELKELVAQQKRQIEELSRQAENLNELQRQSVRMIQQLALYGDKAKKFGVSLGEVNRELKETNNTLGLTADEMNAQLKALQQVTEAMRQTEKTLRRKRRKRGDENSASSLLTEVSVDQV